MVYPEDPDYDREVTEDGQLSGNREPQVRLTFGWRLHVGCWPWDCCSTFDKACNGMEIDGCCCRWAVAHFGQKPAGSPLNCVVLCLLRHGAMRGPAPGERRGATKRSLLGVAAWVRLGRRLDLLPLGLPSPNLWWSGGWLCCVSGGAEGGKGARCLLDGVVREPGRAAQPAEAATLRSVE